MRPSPKFPDHILMPTQKKITVLFCRKFNLPKERVTASFKITPPAESFDKLINPSFWPSGTFVRELKPRSRQRSNKPASVPSGNVSKN